MNSLRPQLFSIGVPPGSKIDVTGNEVSVQMRTAWLLFESIALATSDWRRVLCDESLSNPQVGNFSSMVSYEFPR